MLGCGLNKNFIRIVDSHRRRSFNNILTPQRLRDQEHRCGFSFYGSDGLPKLVPVYGEGIRGKETVSIAMTPSKVNSPQIKALCTKVQGAFLFKSHGFNRSFLWAYGWIRSEEKKCWQCVTPFTTSDNDVLTESQGWVSPQERTGSQPIKHLCVAQRAKFVRFDRTM